jgi:uncharacterized protein (DUF1697 family)
MSARHVALLRGINVGGGNRLPMAQLREIAESLGWAEVATYIQSGNLVFSAEGDASSLGAALRGAVREATGLDVGVFVLTRAEAVALDEKCPWPEVEDLRQVHAFLFADPLTDVARGAVDEAVATAREKGSRDEAVVLGRVIYVHTPDGFGRSVLVPLLDRAAVRTRAGTGPGTARNLATVRRLRALVEN